MISEFLFLKHHLFTKETEQRILVFLFTCISCLNDNFHKGRWDKSKYQESKMLYAIHKFNISIPSKEMFIITVAIIIHFLSSYFTTILLFTIFLNSFSAIAHCKEFKYQK